MELGIHINAITSRYSFHGQFLSCTILGVHCEKTNQRQHLPSHYRQIK